MVVIHNRLLWGWCLFLSLYASSSIAATTPNKGQWFASGEMGWSWPNLNKNKTAVLNGHAIIAPYNVDLYTINHPASEASLSIYGGYRWSTQRVVLPYASVALRYQHVFHFNVGGIIEQYSMPNFKNYTYQFGVSSDILSVLGKLDIVQYGSIAPYISAGVGRAYNQVHHYREHGMTGIIPRVSPAYQNATNDSLEYSVGTGIDYFVNHQFWMSLGFEHAHLGKIKSRDATGPNWAGSSVSLGRLSINSVLLSLNYQFSTA